MKRTGGYFAKNVKECPERVSKDAMPRTYPRDLQRPLDDFAQAIIASGLRHEERMVARIAQGNGVRVIAPADRDAGVRRRDELERQERETIEALDDPSVSTIVGGRFAELIEQRLLPEGPATARVSEPDIVLVERSEAGEVIAVIPGDIKDHKTLSGKKESSRLISDLDDLAATRPIDLPGNPQSEDTLQLAHYWRHLEELGHTAGDPRGFIIGREQQAVWMSLDDVLPEYDGLLAAGLAIVAAAEAADRDPDSAQKSTMPFKATPCKDCTWHDVCMEEMQGHGNGGHVSLVAGVTKQHRAKLEKAGVSDIATLAERSDVLGEDKALRARAVVRDEIYAITHVDLRRADVEIDFDLENSLGPADGSPGEELVYLWGTLASIDGREPTFRAFDDYSDSPDGEVDAFARFWAFLSTSRSEALAAGRTWRTFHYSSHELTKIDELYDRHANHPGMPPRDEVAALLDSGDVVDLLALVKKQTIWPTPSYSIKDIAPRAGFRWDADDAGGGNSTVWYTTAVTDPDPQVREAARRKLLQYNEDDVVAQLAIRDYVEQQLAVGAILMVEGER